MENRSTTITNKIDRWNDLKFGVIPGGLALCNAYEAALADPRLPLPPLPPNIIYVTPDEASYAKDISFRIKAGRERNIRAQKDCEGPLRELLDGLNSSIRTALIPVLANINFNFQRIALIIQYLIHNHMGEPNRDRDTIVSYFKDKQRISSRSDIPILADNFTLQNAIMIKHFEYCTEAGKPCDAAINNIELGKIFHQRINWDSPTLGGLNGLLYSIRDTGFIALIAIAKPWCELYQERDDEPPTIAISSAIRPNDQAQHQAPPSNCFLWDGFHCTRSGICNFNHPLRIDTRRTQSPPQPSRSTFREQFPSRSNFREQSRSRSRSRDRLQDQNSFSRYRNYDNHNRDNESRYSSQRDGFHNSNDSRRNDGNDHRRSLSNNSGGNSNQRYNSFDSREQGNDSRPFTTRHNEADRSPSPFAANRWRGSPAPAPRSNF
jgi:hypothetical protein